MANNDKKISAFHGAIIKSIGAAICFEGGKEKNAEVIIAYAKGDDADSIRFTSVKFSKKKPMIREDFLSAVCQAEKVKEIEYYDFDGKEKDIYVCRAKEGECYDFVPRDSGQNRYVEGFAEIEASNLKFETEVDSIKSGCATAIPVTFNNISTTVYTENSIEYAVINAYNACLLGKVFSKDEFQVETGDGKRAKFEVRSIPGKYVDLSTLYIKPEINEGELFVNSYLTEPMNVINGDDMEVKVYRITYRRNLNDYYIAKC